MASRSATLSELHSLRNELGTGGRGREPKAQPLSSQEEPLAGVAERAPAEPAARQFDTAAGGAPDDDIRALMREAAGFLEEQAGEIAAHPLAIALGGLVVGLIVGRMLPRR